MNGDVICYVVVERAHADDPHPEEGANLPRSAVFRTREEADARVDTSDSDLIVAELVDRRG